MVEQSVSAIGSSSRPHEQAQASTEDVNTVADSAALNRSGGSQHHILSCTNCRKRKVKCTKTSPCAACDKSNISCIFPNRARLPRGRSTAAGPKTTNLELLRRVSKLEELLEKANQVGRDGKDSKDTPRNGSLKAASEDLSSPASNDAPRPQPEASQSPMGGPVRPVISPVNSEEALNKYISSNFWKNLTYEVEGLRKILVEDSEEDEDYPTPVDTDSSGSPINTTRSARILGLAPQHLSSRLAHPSPNQIMMLLSLYVENFDPVFKVLHIPTLRQDIVDASVDIENMAGGKNFEALMFALYYAGVTTLPPEKCLYLFQEEKESMLNRYRYGVEIAFSNADLFTSANMITLQALVIFLICVRCHDDSQFAWTLTAVAVRVAQSLSLHRESPENSITPFMREMRRRLWWQICILDVHAAEDRGSDPMILEANFTTKPPLNINDEDMSPDTIEPLTARTGFTTMTFCTIGHEVFIFHRRCKIGGYSFGDLATPQPMKIEDQIIMMTELQEHLKEKYLIHCDLRNPIAWVTVTCTRLIVKRFWLAIYLPLQHERMPMTRPNMTREQLLTTTVELLESAHSLEIEPATIQWRWYFDSWVQWHALAVALAELCVQNQGPLVQRAWAIIDEVFEPWAAHIADSKHGMLWRPIQKLAAKARMNRRRGGWSSITGNNNNNNSVMLDADLITPVQAPPSYRQKEPELTSLQMNNFVLDPAHIQTMTLDPLQPSPPTQFQPDFLSQYLNTNDTNNILIPNAFAALDDASISAAAAEESFDPNWAEWDAFLKDYERENPLVNGEGVMWQDAKALGMTWF